MPAIEARAALRAMYHPPAWVQGGLSTEDAEFLLELVLKMSPYRILEIGVAAGTSSAALLFALDRATEDADSGELWSLDVCATCYFDPSRPTGAAVAEMYPAHRAHWHQDIDPIGARRFSTPRWSAAFDLALIDANHRHPYPLFDLLYLAPALRPGAWVALHDIDLPRICPEAPAHGAVWLFELWPFEKIEAASSSNIGAVRLPDDLRALVPMALELVGRPWEEDLRVQALPDIFQKIARVAETCRPSAGRGEERLRAHFRRGRTQEEP